MADLMSSGLIDAIIALVVIEAVALLIWRMKTGNGPAPYALLCNLLAGAFLLVALRNALAGASAVWIGLCLVAAFIAHLLDLRGRWSAGVSSSVPRAEKPMMNATLSLRVSEQKSRPARQAQTEE